MSSQASLNQQIFHNLSYYQQYQPSQSITLSQDKKCINEAPDGWFLSPYRVDSSDVMTHFEWTLHTIRTQWVYLLLEKNEEELSQLLTDWENNLHQFKKTPNVDFNTVATKDSLDKLRNKIHQFRSHLDTWDETCSEIRQSASHSQLDVEDETLQQRASTTHSWSEWWTTNILPTNTNHPLLCWVSYVPTNIKNVFQRRIAPHATRRNVALTMLIGWFMA